LKDEAKADKKSTEDTTENIKKHMVRCEWTHKSWIDTTPLKCKFQKEKQGRKNQDKMMIYKHTTL